MCTYCHGSPQQLTFLWDLLIPKAIGTTTIINTNLSVGPQDIKP